TARSAPPADVGANIYSYIVAGATSNLFVRPDRVAGVPLYVYGAPYPGGRAININAFAAPPSTNPTSFYPAREGNFERDGLRNFPANQWDIAVRRTFHLTERVQLQARMEAFNVLNHPNFGYFGGSNSTVQAVNLTYGMKNGSSYIVNTNPI